MSKQSDLIAYVFEGPRVKGGEQLSRELLGWMDASTRFTGFVETYRDKIRKKVRVTRETESLLDVRAELETAFCLLGDRRLAVVYEPLASEKRRGPDFGVIYRANLPLYVEVARMRAEPGADPAGRALRIVRILLDKLGQMQPGKANLLLIHAGAETARTIDLARLMAEIKRLAETKDPGFYALSRYSGPADFYKELAPLSGMILRAADGALPPPVQAWQNKQARPGLDEKILRQVALALQALPGTGQVG